MSGTLTDRSGRGDRAGGTLSVTTLAAVYVGTVVGAGFASGQEVLQFFSLHGARGLGALAIATVSLGFFGYLLLRAGAKLKAASHGPVLGHVAGPVLGRLVDFVLTFFLFGGTAAMFAGSGATLAQQFGLPYWVGLAGMAAATALTVLSGIRGVVASVSAVAPFLLASVLVVSLATLATSPPDLSFAEPGRAAVRGWGLAGATYGSYNLILATAVLVPVARFTPRPRLLTGAVLGALGLGLGALAVDLTILAHVPEAAATEVPMLLAAGRLSPLAALAYTAVLLAEVYTTAVSSLFGFVNRVAREGSRRFGLITVGATAGAAVGAGSGFSVIVATLYPAVGYAGFVLLGALAVAFMRRKI